MERNARKVDGERRGTTRVRDALVATTALVAVRGSAGIAAAACDPTICVGGATACTVSGTNTIDDDCTLDWSAKDVTLASGAVMRTSTEGHNFTVLTDDFDVRGTLQARGAPALTPLSISSSGFFTVTSTGKVDVSRGGTVEITAGGTVQSAASDFSADGGGASVDGGRIAITSTGSSVTTTSAVHATGAAGGYGGEIWITSEASTVSIGGALTTNGANGGDGGGIALTSAGDMTIAGHVTADGNGTGAWGGAIAVDSGGALAATHHLHALGASDGDGGGIEVLAVGDAEFDDTVKVNGGANGGTGGGIEVSAASVVINADFTSNGGPDADSGTIDIAAETGDVEIASTAAINALGGNGGSGDTIDIAAAGDVIQDGPINCTGAGGGDGGWITIDADGAVTLGAAIAATGSGADSSGGTIDVTAGTNHTLTATRGLDARSTSNTGWVDGDVGLEACNVSVTGTGDLRTRNTDVGFGRNFVKYYGTFTVSGTMRADDPAATSCASPTSGNIVTCRCTDTSPADGTCDTPLACASSPTTTGATINPAALVCPAMTPACG